MHLIRGVDFAGHRQHLIRSELLGDIMQTWILVIIESSRRSVGLISQVDDVGRAFGKALTGFIRCISDSRDRAAKARKQATSGKCEGWQHEGEEKAVVYI